MGRSRFGTARLHGMVALVAVMVLPACSGSASPAADEGAPAAASRQMDMLQVMRAFPFPHANVIFDTQTIDPEGPQGKESTSFHVYRWGDSGTYAGWPGVENSALALTELGPILLAPRTCSNGRPAPVDREDWKAGVQNVIAAGEEAYTAARTKNLDEMLATSETLTNACASCHDIYRDVDLAGGERCTVPAE